MAAGVVNEDCSIDHVVRAGDAVWRIDIADDAQPYKIISLIRLDELSNRDRFLFASQALLIRPAQ